MVVVICLSQKGGFVPLNVLDGGRLLFCSSRSWAFARETTQ